MIGDAAQSHVLSGKTFTNSTSSGLTGSMTNKGGTTTAASGSIASSKLSVAIPEAGYYNTSSKLTVDVGTATKAQVLSGKTFTSTAGVKASGSMADYSSNVQTVTCNSNTGTQTYSTLADGYHTSIKVNQTAPYNAGKAAATLKSTSSYSANNVTTYTVTLSETPRYACVVFSYLENKNADGSKDSSIANRMTYTLSGKTVKIDFTTQSQFTLKVYYLV